MIFFDFQLGVTKVTKAFLFRHKSETAAQHQEHTQKLSTFLYFGAL